MTATTNLLRLTQATQALSLVGENVRVAKKKKKTTGDILGLGLTNIAGTSLIQAQGDIIGGL